VVDNEDPSSGFRKARKPFPFSSPSPAVSSAPQNNLFLEISQPEEGDIF